MKRARADDDASQAKRKRVSFGGKPAETALAAQVYGSRVRALNSAFASWALAQLEKAPGTAILEAARDYVAYATDLEAQFLTAHTDVLSFGSGDCGQLAHGLESERDTIVGSPRRILSLRDKKVRVVACGGLHNISCTADGQCYTWGCNDEGSLGRGGDEAAPCAVDVGAVVVSVAAGDTQSFAVTQTGDVFGWGCYKDKEGKQWFDVSAKNDKPRRKQTTPMLVPGLDKVVTVRCGAAFNVALLDDGAAVTWGIGEVGELGRPVRPFKTDDYDLRAITSDHLTPSPVDLKRFFAHNKCKVVACGAYHLLIATDAALFASGLNNYGQLGDGSETNSSKLVAIDALSECSILALDGGQHHSLALLGDGSLYSWGRADYGQLGLGNKQGAKPGDHVSTPTRLPLEDPITAFAAGSNHNLALARSGTVYSWGFGDMYALGLGPPHRDQFEPKAIDINTALQKRDSGEPKDVLVTQVNAGGQHSVLVANVKSFKGAAS